MNGRRGSDGIVMFTAALWTSVEIIHSHFYVDGIKTNKLKYAPHSKIRLKRNVVFIGKFLQSREYGRKTNISLRDGPILRPEESYRVCVCVCVI